MVATVPPAPSSGFTAAPTAALRRALSAAASPDPTLWSIVVVFVIAAVVILPSLGLLYYLDQRDLLETVTEPGVTSV